MVRELLERMAEMGHLRTPEAGRREAVWATRTIDPDSFRSRMAVAIEHPADRLVIAAEKQKGRSGAYAHAVPSMKNLGLPVGVDPVEWFSQQIACVPAHLNLEQRRVIGRRQVPDYHSLIIGEVYLIPEVQPILNRWSGAGGTGEIHRFHLVIPRRVSPRGTNVYGDCIVIEQPVTPRFVQREGWRIWLSNVYDEDNPSSKIGQLRILEDDDALRRVHHLGRFLDGIATPWPFLINWTVDGTALVPHY